MQSYLLVSYCYDNFPVKLTLFFRFCILGTNFELLTVFLCKPMGQSVHHQLKPKLQPTLGSIGIMMYVCKVIRVRID